MVLFTNNSKQNYLSAGNCPSTLNNVRFGVEDWVLQGKKQLHSNRNCSLGSGVEPFWGFRGQIFLTFNIIKVTKRLTVTLINYIIGLRSYASLWPTCFSWLIYQLLAKYNTKLTRITNQELHINFGSWSSGFRERYLPSKYYICKEAHASKVWKNVFSKVRLQEAQA